MSSVVKREPIVPIIFTVMVVVPLPTGVIFPLLSTVTTPVPLDVNDMLSPVKVGLIFTAVVSVLFIVTELTYLV